MNELTNSSNFLFYADASGNISVQVMIGEDTVWMSQKGMSEVFETDRTSITKHIQNIFFEEEVEEKSNVQKLHIAGSDRPVVYYSLDIILAVGYRINSFKATRFRQWSTRILKEYLIKGFVLDDERLKQGNRIFNKDFFQELIDRVRDIRASEKLFYEKVRDLYATAVDYDKDDPRTKEFFATVQNKLEFAIVGKTSAEIIKSRANSNEPFMNLKTWKNAGRGGKIQKSDVKIAKNYLNPDEISRLNLIVNMFLDYAENIIRRGSVIKMVDWIDRLDRFLIFTEHEVLKNAGSGQRDAAKAFAEGEYDKYKVYQDSLPTHEFERLAAKLLSKNELPKEFLEPPQTESINSLSEDMFNKSLGALMSVPPPKRSR